MVMWHSKLHYHIFEEEKKELVYVAWLNFIRATSWEKGQKSSAYLLTQKKKKKKKKCFSRGLSM